MNPVNPLDLPLGGASIIVILNKVNFQEMNKDSKESLSFVL